jgi:hypothetical protein
MNGTRITSTKVKILTLAFRATLSAGQAAVRRKQGGSNAYNLVTLSSIQPIQIIWFNSWLLNWYLEKHCT